MAYTEIEEAKRWQKQDQPRRRRRLRWKQARIPRRKVAPDTETPFTMSIPDAGRRYYNIGRAASYAAADDGHIPFVRIGRLKRALPRLIEKRLAGSND